MVVRLRFLELLLFDDVPALLLTIKIVSLLSSVLSHPYLFISLFCIIKTCREFGAKYTQVVQKWTFSALLKLEGSAQTLENAGSSHKTDKEE